MRIWVEENSVTIMMCRIDGGKDPENVGGMIEHQWRAAGASVKVRGQI